MSSVLKFFSRFLLFFDRDHGGGIATPVMEPVVQPIQPEPVPVALVEPPVVRTDLARAAPDQIAKRDELRQRVKGLGGDLSEIENIIGDCPDQVGIQIKDNEDWLSRNS